MSMKNYVPWAVDLKTHDVDIETGHVFKKFNTFNVISFKRGDKVMSFACENIEEKFTRDFDPVKRRGMLESIRLHKPKIAITFWPKFVAGNWVFDPESFGNWLHGQEVTVAVETPNGLSMVMAVTSVAHWNNSFTVEGTGSY